MPKEINLRFANLRREMRAKVEEIDDLRRQLGVYEEYRLRLIAAEGVVAGLRSLVAEWRERARRQGAMYALGINECANELEQALALPRPGRAQEE